MRGFCGAVNWAVSVCNSLFIYSHLFSESPACDSLFCSDADHFAPYKWSSMTVEPAMHSKKNRQDMTRFRPTYGLMNFNQPLRFPFFPFFPVYSRDWSWLVLLLPWWLNSPPQTLRHPSSILSVWLSMANSEPPDVYPQNCGIHGCNSFALRVCCYRFYVCLHWFVFWDTYNLLIPFNTVCSKGSQAIQQVLLKASKG